MARGSAAISGRCCGWPASGLPLPFAAVDNRRSLLARDNLVDLLAMAATHPAAAGRVWLAADGEDLSTADWSASWRAGRGGRPGCSRCRTRSLPSCAGLPGLRPTVRRLTQSLQVDAAPTRAALGWSPPVPVETALAATARAFRDANSDAAGGI